MSSMILVVGKCTTHILHRTEVPKAPSEEERVLMAPTDGVEFRPAILKLAPFATPSPPTARHCAARPEQPEYVTAAYLIT